MRHSCYLLWLSGVEAELLAQIASLPLLASEGVELHVTPLPLSEQQQCAYQILTGMGAGSLGRFDAVRPEAYQVVDETNTPEGAAGHLLTDVLHARHLAVISLEIERAVELDVLAGQSYDFALVRLRNAHMLTLETLEALIQRFSALAGAADHLAMLTDVQAATSHTLLNVNDFLADLGLLEVGTPRQREAIIWSETLAYTLGSGQLWVNMRGREQQGVVSAGREYQDVCEALIRELRNWRDPRTHEPVVAQVFKKEDIYSGDYLFKASDLVITYRSGYAPSAKAFALDFDGQSLQTVQHGASLTSAQAAEARLYIKGPIVAQGQVAYGRTIDILPTLFYLLGQPLPYGIDGEVLLPLFTNEYRTQQRITLADDESDQLSEEEEGMIVDRLRDLGYLG